SNGEPSIRYAYPVSSPRYCSSSASSASGRTVVDESPTTSHATCPALRAGKRLYERVRAGHPDDHAAELPLVVDVEEVAVVHVVLRAVVQLADVALLGRHLPRFGLDDDVLDLLEDRDGAGAEVREHAPDLLRAREHGAGGLDGHDAVVSEVGQDRVDVLRVDGLEVRVGQGCELVPRQPGGLRGHKFLLG